MKLSLRSELHAEFIGIWERFGVTIASARNGS